MSALRRFLLLLACLVTSACVSDLTPIQGSTVRVAKPKVADGTELELRIFTNRDQCGRLKPEDKERCLPWVDRASGEVHLSFQFFLGSEPWPLALGKEHVQVTHQGSIIQEGLNKQSYTIIPHDPIRSSQLYVLLIDGSSSMNLPARDPRIERVREALLLPEVVDAFFPEEVRTGVLLVQFISDRVVPVGGEMHVVETPREYKRLVRQELQAGTGYTFLYDAVRQATGTLLNDEPAVKRFLETSGGAPTVMALTDGFNNQARQDTCGDNASRLELVLRHLANVRGREVDLKTRPQVFTVGLGRPFLPTFTLPDDRTRVQPVVLCSRKWKDAPIDGNLEKSGIDNASLAWIADFGGGTSYVKQDTSGLGEAFRAAAAERYEWFEVKYRLDPFYLRRSFSTGLRLLSFAEAEATVTLHPSGWLDAPPGLHDPDGWSRRAPLLLTAALVMPLLGLMVTLGFLSPALFNARRVVFGRMRPPRSPVSSGRAAPAAQAGESGGIPPSAPAG